MINDIFEFAGKNNLKFSELESIHCIIKDKTYKICLMFHDRILGLGLFTFDEQFSDSEAFYKRLKELNTMWRKYLENKDAIH